MSNKQIVEELEAIRDSIHAFSRGTVYDMIDELIEQIKTEL